MWGLALLLFESNQFNSERGTAILQGFSPVPSLAPRLGAPGAGVTRALLPA